MENSKPLWSTRCIDSAHEFTALCAELRATNPSDETAINRIMNDLMTELWDLGFSQTEIINSFQTALKNLSRYTAEEARRGDKG